MIVKNLVVGEKRKKHMENDFSVKKCFGVLIFVRVSEGYSLLQDQNVVSCIVGLYVRDIFK